MRTVLLAEPVAEETVMYLAEKGYQIKHGRGLEQDVLLADLADCDAIIVRVAKIDRALPIACPALQVIAKHSAGYDAIDVDAAKALGRHVVYTPHANALSVAEHVVALMLACAKCLPRVMRGYAAGDFAIKDRAGSIEISGKTLGLIGLGRIGAEVARIAMHGFGIHVLAYDPYLVPQNCPPGVTLCPARDDLLVQADVVSLHLPLTEQTRHSMDAAAFARMKPCAMLINTSRGAVVDQAALLHALETGAIAAAGLDVCDPEPCPPNSPLFALDYVVLTPHSAAAMHDAMVRMGRQATDEMDAVFRTGTSPNCLC